MQSDNTSKKPRKVAKEKTLAITDSSTTETTKKTRSAKAPSAKSSVTNSSASPKHHHSAVTEKVSKNPVRKAPASETVPSEPVVVPASVSEKKYGYEDVARLAHSFWAERNYDHGFADEDWLRAENELKAAR